MASIDKGFRLEAPNLDTVEPDEHHFELPVHFRTLELTDHQRTMLQKPEDRIAKCA